jgi:hypothetical protein
VRNLGPLELFPGPLRRPLALVQLALVVRAAADSVLPRRGQLLAHAHLQRRRARVGLLNFAVRNAIELRERPLEAARRKFLATARKGESSLPLVAQGPLQLLRSVFRDAEDGFGCLRVVINPLADCLERNDHEALRLGPQRSLGRRSTGTAAAVEAAELPSTQLREVEREGRPILEVDLATSCRLRAAAEEGPHLRFETWYLDAAN